jgi:hypothetical protein
MTVRGGNYASSLRRAAKRRESLATGRPFAAATVGFCDAYLYCKGVLCYTLDDRLRILDLHHSAQYEIVVSIPALLIHALSDIGDNTKGVFQVLYCCDGIIACIYRSSGPDSTAWLIAFTKNSRRISVVQELESTDKIFVRHNKDFLYYGTHSEIGTDGYKKWVIHGYEFRKRKWFDQKVHLPDMVGSEIGSTICFEFHHEYFYALSNQTSFEVEEIDWTSFYHCVRFPLESPCKERLEKTEDNSMWRRQHQEGPIDDRWTSLSLDVDESTGELKIVESRKEWYLGSSRSKRTYYTTDIKFPDRIEDEDFGFGYALPASEPSVPTVTTSDSSTSSSSSSSSLASTTSSSSATAPTTATASSPKTSTHDLSTLPDDPILRLLRPDDHPHHMQPPPRRPQNTHPGNDGSSQPTFILSDCRIRSYHTSASAFVDMVDDPLESDWKGTQRLRIRAGSRKLGPPLFDDAGLIRGPSSNLTAALKEMYREQPVQFWPPAQDPNNDSEHVNALYRLLNPPSHLGNVEGTADNRSFLYVTGGYDKPQAILFVSFDPAIRLKGLERWGGLQRGIQQKGVGKCPHIDGRASRCGSNKDDLGKGYIDVDETDRTVIIDKKGKGKAKSEPMVHVLPRHIGADFQEISASLFANGDMERSWAWNEKAMYQDIARGYYFGLDRITKL